MGDKSSLTRFIFGTKLGKDPLVLERKTKKSSEIYIYQSSKTRPHKTETENRMISKSIGTRQGHALLNSEITLRHTLLPFCQTIPSDYSVQMGFN